MLIVCAAHIVVARALSPKIALRLLPPLLLTGYWLWYSIFVAQVPEATLNDLFIGWGMLGSLTVVYTEVFLNLYRGFSYTLVSDIACHAPLTEDELCANFAGGIGEHEMMKRRFASMRRARLIAQDGTNTRLLPRGIFFGRMSAFLRTLLHLEAGGGEPIHA